MNDNKELIEALKTLFDASKWAHLVYAETPTGSSNPSFDGSPVEKHQVRAMQVALHKAESALRAAPSTPPAPAAGTVGESERVERLEAALAQETFFANTRIAELEAELAMRKKEETRENRERESLERSIRITKDAITELDDGLCKILGITDKPAALDGLKAYLAELEARLRTPPPPSPDAKLGEAVANLLERHRDGPMRSHELAELLLALTRPAAPSATREES